MKGLMARARRDLISRTARVWSRLGRSIIKERGAELDAWSSRLMASAEDAVMKGTDIDAPPFPPTWGDALRDDLLYAMAQGFWLQHVYMQEARAERQGKRYRVPQDDPTKAALEALTKRKMTLADSDDWHKVIPKDAIDWIEGYTPKLAGTLEKDVLDRVKREVQGSLAKGTSVRERVKALREASPKVAAMSKARVEAIARTEVTRADTMGRLLSMKRDEDVIGVEFSAVLDSRTTPGCERRHGLVMRLDDPRLPENAPPRHVNCRSMLLPVSTWDAPDGLLTSHEFDDGGLPPSMQRPEDVEVVRAVLAARRPEAGAGLYARPSGLDMIYSRPDRATGESEARPQGEDTSAQRSDELELAQGLTQETRIALRDAFKDAPRSIKDLYLGHKDSLFGILLDAEPREVHYSSRYKVIHLHKIDDTVALLHEFGHHVDRSMGKGGIAASSSDKMFIDAVDAAMASVKGNGRRKAELRQKMRDIMVSGGKGFNTDGLSDIFCAVVRADSSKKDLWGQAGHRPQYYKDDRNVRQEIFADLFLLHAQNDREAIAHLESTFPDILKAFRSMIGGVGDV